MPRSRDLDTVAPDDLINTSANNVTSDSTPIIPKTSPSPKFSSDIPHQSTHLSPDDPLAQKVYGIFGHTRTPFSSQIIFPNVLTFAEKTEDEIILVGLRSHWFTNVSWVITAFIMFIIPTFLRFIPTHLFAPNLQIILIFSWYLMTFAFSFEKFLSWYFDLYFITNKRIVDIDFNNLLDKKFSEADIDRIQDVTSRISGVSQTIFNYGTVLIQTAAEQNEIIFEKVKNPEKVVKILQELRQYNNPHHE